MNKETITIPVSEDGSITVTNDKEFELKGTATDGKHYDATTLTKGNSEQTKRQRLG